VEPWSPADDDQIIQAITAQTRRFCEREIDARAVDAATRIPAAVLSGLGELGLFGVTVPEAFGGAGRSLSDACRVVEVLARFDRSVAVSVGLHLGLGTRGLIRYGDPRQHARYLPPLADGRMVAAFSTTEPGAGSDLSSLQTTAREVGGDFVVSGEKSYVTNGGFAGLFTVAVSSPGLGGAARGQSLVLVEPGDPGFSVEREEHKLGLRGSSTTGLRFDEARLPRERLLGEPGQGARMLGHILSWGRTLMSAGCCGAAAFALERTASHLATRRQFGRPLGALDVVRERHARQKARHFAMEALVLTAASQVDDEALATWSLAAKVYCSEGAQFVIDEAVQLHGALGFIEDTGLALALRDVRVTRIFEGANDVLLTHLGAGEVSRRSRASSSPRLADLERSLTCLVDELKETHRLRLFRSPRLLHALGRAAHEVMAARAAVVRAEAMERQAGDALASIVTLEALDAVARARAVSVDDGLFRQALGLERTGGPS
jgi:alkylation response protein AidB-like acyl-CoA dehydrogenase